MCTVRCSNWSSFHRYPFSLVQYPASNVRGQFLVSGDAGIGCCSFAGKAINSCWRNCWTSQQWHPDLTGQLILDAVLI
jgi:hypothetical protein